MFEQLKKDLKDERSYWEIDLIELETLRRKWKKTIKFAFYGIIVFGISFLLGQSVKSWLIMDSSGFVLIILFCLIILINNDLNLINHYIYLKKKEENLL